VRVRADNEGESGDANVHLRQVGVVSKLGKYHDGNLGGMR